MKRTASRPAPLQLDGAGAGEAHVRWKTPKVVVPRSPYNIDGDPHERKGASFWFCSCTGDAEEEKLAAREEAVERTGE